MAVSQTSFGSLPGGGQASLFTISAVGGARLVLSDFGARVVGLTVPDKTGRLGDVVLGYDDAAAYLAQGRYFGAVCGRYANRLGGAAFTLGGKTYRLSANDGPHSLHGGGEGFDARLWKYAAAGENSAAFTLQSPNGDEGYPGNLTVTVTYTFTKDYTLRIDYRAQSDADTPLNLTNHAYFNLAGHGAGHIGGHSLQIDADYYTPVDGELIPHGEIAPVEGTPFNFRRPASIGEGLRCGHPQLQAGGGYDHNFVLAAPERGALRRAAAVAEPQSGRLMEVYTTKPGVQLYTGNSINDFSGKGGAAYVRHGAFCLETQYFPNSAQVCHFPTPFLKAGQVYSQQTEYRFSVGNLV